MKKIAVILTALLAVACNDNNKDKAISAIFAQEQVLFEKEIQFKGQFEQNTPQDVELHWRIASLKTGIDWLDKLLLEKSKQNKQNVAQEFDQKQQALQKEPVFLSQFTQSIDFVSQREKLALFVKNQYSFDGGAHGMPLVEYWNVDLAQRRILTLSDLFSPVALAQVKDLLWQVYHNEGEQPFTEQEDFTVSAQFLLGIEGITFVYQPYEIGAFAEGFKELKLPWWEVERLLKEEFKQQQYFVLPQFVEE